MSSLTKMRIDDFATMKYGKMPPKNVVSNEGYPIYSGYRVTGFAKEYLYKEPELIVVARGVGGTGDVKISPPEAWITNLSIVLSLSPELVDKTFLYYRLGREPLKERLNTGAAQAQITIENLRSYEIEVPDLTSQRRIASILSSYDDLIENNQRRITLLEEAARLLYREWFVHFRFPGHEHVKVIEGVPEGWLEGKVSDLGLAITGKTPSKKVEANFGDDLPFIKTPDMHGNAFVIQTEESLSEQGANTQKNKTLPTGSVLVSCIGTVGAVSMNSGPAQTNQQINSVVPKKNEWQFFAYFALKSIKPRLEAMGGGATMANVNKTKFESVPILIPPEALIESYYASVKAQFELIEKLSRQNLELARARDLLLPRLMDGRLEI
nr:restriction endonuclease subunit S [Amylibacter sp.]